MKLSKSKLALAKIINENGGWKFGEFAWYGNATKSGYFGVTKPSYNVTGGTLDAYGRMEKFECAKISNWHQCVLSREEYYQAYPKADADGWIEWSGGMKSPVESGVFVDVKTKDGSEHYDQLLGDACWHDNWGDANIIAYRLHAPEVKFDTSVVEPNPAVKPEFCESVTRSITEPNAFELAYDPSLVKLSNGRIGSESIDELCAKVTEENKHQHIDAKPTIEQLAQDYRNAKDYAVRLQKEAGEAVVKSESFAVEIRKKIIELQELIG